LTIYLNEKNPTVPTHIQAHKIMEAYISAKVLQNVLIIDTQLMTLLLILTTEGVM